MKEREIIISNVFYNRKVVIYMNKKDSFPVEKEAKDVFVITMDVIEECLSEAFEKEEKEETKIYFPN
jgi:hypothetical protein